MNNFLQQILSGIGGGAQNLSDYFKAPGNPYSVTSPIPNASLVTRNLPAGVQSPIPQNQILQHVQGGSGAQNTMASLGHLNQWLGAFNPQPQVVPQKVQAQTLAPKMPAEKMAQPVQTPTPTPTPQPFADFKTAKVPAQFQDLISNSAQQAGVDPNVFASVLFSEHSFIADNNKTPSYDKYGNFAGYDRGIAQINSMAHPDVTDEQAFDPNFAIPYAANLLKSYIDQSGSLQRGILAYNHGVTGQRSIQDPTQDTYYQKVVGGISPQGRKRLGL